MHWWKRSSPEEEQLRVQAQQEAETSQLSLLAGGLPTQAKRRLSQETAAGHLLFSSDLSTREFVLTRKTGYRPLRQVMGSSIYHVGWQYTWNYPSYTTAYELMTVTNAHQHAAQLALDRLEQEAMLLKARCDRGTAVRLPMRRCSRAHSSVTSPARSSGRCSRLGISQLVW